MTSSYHIPVIGEITTEPVAVMVGTAFRLRVHVEEIEVHPNWPYCGTLNCGMGVWPWP